MKAINAKKMSNIELDRVACRFVEEIEYSKLEDPTSNSLVKKLMSIRLLFHEKIDDSRSEESSTLRMQLTAALLNTYKYINAMEISTGNSSWTRLSEKLVEEKVV